MEPRTQDDRPARIERVRFLLDIATEALCRVGTEFHHWALAVAEAAADRNHPEPAPSELIWAWTALRSDRELNSAFGHLEPVPAWMKARARVQDGRLRIEVCPRGVIFEVILRQDMDLPEAQLERAEKGWLRPRAFIRLEEPLAMVRGRAGRLLSAGTSCTLITPAIEVVDRRRAALVFGVSPNAVRFVGANASAIHVPCRSLNHAYILASQRFERSRRSRGGRVYENLIFFYPDRKCTLDWARMAAERGGSAFVKEHELVYPIDVPWEWPPAPRV